MTDLYIDLLIKNNDLVLDSASVPELISNRASIGQDIAHMIRETGYLKELVAERSRLKRSDIITQIELEMEKDIRLIPGTSKVTDQDNGEFLVSATTVDFGEVVFNINQGVQVE